ncbi:MAG: hypothetical protein FWD31_06705, partial [Planctomycetaceae bacterium]|nr:hypothetical protein [Planctomycetaceae bacterium]
LASLAVRPNNSALTPGYHIPPLWGKIPIPYPLSPTAYSLQPTAYSLWPPARYPKPFFHRI